MRKFKKHVNWPRRKYRPMAMWFGVTGGVNATFWWLMTWKIQKASRKMSSQGKVQHSFFWGCWIVVLTPQVSWFWAWPGEWSRFNAWGFQRYDIVSTNGIHLFTSRSKWNVPRPLDGESSIAFHPTLIVWRRGCLVTPYYKPVPSNTISVYNCHAALACRPCSSLPTASMSS